MDKIFSVFVFILFVSCQENENSNSSNSDIYNEPESMSNAPTIKVESLNSTSLVVNEKFKEVKFVPFFGGKLFDIESSRDSHLDTLYNFHIGGYLNGKPSILKYSNLEYMANVEFTLQGPNKIINVDQFLIEENGYTILDRAGLSIVEYENGEIKNRIFHGMYGLDFEKVGDNFIIYVGNNRDRNTGRLCLIDRKGEILKNYFNITENTDHINIRKNLFIYRNNDKILFKEPFYSTIYSVEDKGVKPYLNIDFGRRSIPDEYIQKEYSNVAEFMMPLHNMDYFYNEGSFLELEDHSIFHFMSKGLQHMAIVSRSNGEVLSPTMLVFKIGEASFSVDNLVDNSPRGVIPSKKEVYWIFDKEKFTDEEKREILNQEFLSLDDNKRQELFSKWDDEYRFGLLTIK